MTYRNAVARTAIAAVGMMLVVASLSGCRKPPPPPTAVAFDQLVGRAFALNESGIVVGSATFPGATRPHAFAYDTTTGKVTDLGTPGGDTSSALDVNERGQVAGWVSRTVPEDPNDPDWITLGPTRSRPVVWDLRTGTSRTLETTGSYAATGINDAGDVVGSNLTRLYPESIYTYLWSGGGRRTLPQLGRVYSRATPRAINDAGWVVGAQGQSCCGGVAAWLWTPTGGTVELPDASVGAGGSVTAEGLNETGDIVGTAWWHVESPAPAGVGPATQLDLPPNAFARLLDVNSSRTAIGTRESGAAAVSVCRDLPSGRMTELGPGEVTDINDRGEIALTVYDAAGVGHPKVWPAGTCP